MRFQFSKPSTFQMLLMILLLASCVTKQYFTVNSASYQPAIFNESSRITTIELIVSDVDSNVAFTDLVFENLRIPVISDTLADNKIKISGYIQIGGKLADHHYQIITEEPNKLYFIVGNNLNSVLLDSIQRKNTQLP